MNSTRPDSKQGGGAQARVSKSISISAKSECIGLADHLRAFVLSDEEVALIGENTKVVLRGKLYTQLVPLLDGTLTEAEIVAALDGKAPEAMAYFALLRLEKSGYLASASDCGNGWKTWWQAHDKDAAALLDAQGRAIAAIGVIGVDTVVAEALAKKLDGVVRIANNVDSASFEICLVDDYLRPELGTRLKAALVAGRGFLPVRPVGLQAWLGPCCTPGNPLNWNGFIKRLSANRPTETLILSRGFGLPLLADTQTPSSIDVALSMTALAIGRCVSGDTPETLDHALMTIDLDSLQTSIHPIPIACAEFTTTKSDIAEVQRIVLSPNPKKFTADGGHRVCSPEETQRRLEPLVDPITGIVPGVDSISRDDRVHVFHARQIFPGDARPVSENRLLGHASAACGKGQTRSQSRVSCIAEAVERYSCKIREGERVRTATLAAVGEEAIRPESVLQFSDRQYETRQSLNAKWGEGFNRVPERFDSSQEIDWTPLWSLSHERVRWLPSKMCFFNYQESSSSNVLQFARADSNGCASGNTIEEAILQGFYELIERDAVAIWWYNRLKARSIDLKSFKQPFFDGMLQYWRSRGRVLHVLDVTSDIGVPVVLAISWRDETGDRIQFGLGCHSEPRLAISRALSELNQTAHAEDDASTENLDPETTMGRWMMRETIESQPYVVPTSEDPVRAEAMNDHSTDDISEDVRRLVGRCADMGHETLVFDHTHPDIGFPTARVVVPGLRHFWCRLAPGRLYDVPVSMGWRDKPMHEADLNPIPYFL